MKLAGRFKDHTQIKWLTSVLTKSIKIIINNRPISLLNKIQ
jgi:hypothetical protein